jgi:hypothetical protein
MKKSIVFDWMLLGGSVITVAGVGMRFSVPDAMIFGGLAAVALALFGMWSVR